MTTTPRKGKVPVGPGQIPKDAVLMDIESAKEPWAEYQLSDGSLVKIKQVVSEIWKVENEYDGEGNPVYAVKSTPLMNVTADPKLKKV